jgi:polyhydroxyalkanoate synthesis regulator phasin
LVGGSQRTFNLGVDTLQYIDDTKPTGGRRMYRMKKSVVAAGLTAGLIGGGAAGVILGSGGVSGAQETATTTTAPAAGTEEGVRGDRPDPSAKLGETLAPLVADGTITQAQADKVVETLLAARPEGGPGGRGHGPGGGRFGGEAAATALGITVDELRTALREGSTIAEVAQEKGIDVQVVIDAIVAERTEQIAAAVADGKLTQEQADERLADLEAKVTERVNQALPEGGRGGRGGPPPEDAPADDAPAEGESGD